MADTETARRAEPVEFNIVLESPKFTPEEWERFIKLLLLKHSMRQQPPTKSDTVMSFVEGPEVIVIEEPAKG
jgi:hypothetical protein